MERSQNNSNKSEEYPSPFSSSGLTTVSVRTTCDTSLDFWCSQQCALAITSMVPICVSETDLSHVARWPSI